MARSGVTGNSRFSHHHALPTTEALPRRGVVASSRALAGPERRPKSPWTRARSRRCADTVSWQP